MGIIVTVSSGIEGETTSTRDGYHSASSLLQDATTQSAPLNYLSAPLRKLRQLQKLEHLQLLVSIRMTWSFNDHNNC